MYYTLLSFWPYPGSFGMPGSEGCLMQLALLLVAAVMLDAPAAQEDSLADGRSVEAGVILRPGIFLMDRCQDFSGSDPLFDLPSWLSHLIDGGIIPDLPDLELRISKRRLSLGCTFRF